MTLSRKLIVTAALAALPFAALAQSNTPPSPVVPNFADRNATQQRAIEQGLQSGQLTVQEASRLERQESGVERMQSRALRDGTLNANEQAHITQAQDRVGRQIARQSSDAQITNPNSPSSRRMQADVQRDVNQQERIAQGVRSGQLTGGEAGRLEQGQSHINRMEARAGADGHVGRYEQQRIQGADNRQSHNIYNQRHDGQFRHDGGGRRDFDRRPTQGNWNNGGNWNHGGGGNHAPQFQAHAAPRAFPQQGGGFQHHSMPQRSYAMAGGRRFR